MKGAKYGTEKNMYRNIRLLPRKTFKLLYKQDVSFRPFKT